MNYSIHHKEEKGLNLIVLKDERNDTEVAVIPAFGALLHRFKIKSGNKYADVIDHYADLEQLRKLLPTSYKSSKLSPFVCRISEGKYNFDGKQFQFSNRFLDGSAIHGLLFDRAFSVVEESPGNASAMVSLEYVYHRDYDQYPFDYSCLVRYELLPEQTLSVQTVLSNLGNSAIPIADGWHPYFSLGGNVDEWILHFNAEAAVEFDDKLIPTGRLLDFEQFKLPTLIGKTFLDNCFLIKPDIKHPSCELFNPNNKLKVSFFPDEGYSYLQIYTPPHRNSIAIENLSSAPDSFNNKMGLTILGPGQSESFRLHYKVDFL
jgi:aldose 1-epimerase